MCYFILLLNDQGTKTPEWEQYEYTDSKSQAQQWARDEAMDFGEDNVKIFYCTPREAKQKMWALNKEL